MTIARTLRLGFIALAMACGGACAQTGQLPNNRVLGNVSGATAPAAPLTATQLTTLCNAFTSLLPGCVGASGGGTTTFLRADGAWSSPSGTPGGSSGQVQTNNGTGGFAGITNTQLTALINPATAALPGALPAWPNTTTTYFRGDGTYQTLNCAALSGVGTGCAAAAGITALTGDVTASGSGSVAATLANTAVTPASYTNMNATVDSKGRITAAANGTGGGATSAPQGRLTLTSGTPIMTTDVAAATTVYYTPAIGLFVPLYNGSALTMTTIGAELSQATTDATKSPAAVTTNSNYDIFVWSDTGTMRATRGPPWTSDTARGTGAGTTELDFTTTPGVPLNKNAITNGPAADRGTYVGTIRSNGTSTIDMKFGTAAASGGAATLGVWNAYNRVTTRAKVSDTTGSWSYTSNTPQAVHASTTNRASFVSGLQTDAISALYLDGITTAATSGAFCLIGFGMDVTNAFDRNTGGATVAAVSNFIWNETSGFYGPQLGFHFIQALEAGDGTHACTFGGDATANTRQGLEIKTPM